MSRAAEVLNPCESGEHLQVVKDRFAALPGVTRHVPGDCFCLLCGSPVPAWWNNGRPVPVESTEAAP